MGRCTSGASDPLFTLAEDEPLAGKSDYRRIENRSVPSAPLPAAGIDQAAALTRCGCEKRKPLVVRI